MTKYAIVFFNITFLLFIRGYLLDTCNFNVKMKQILRGEGFHRNITYGIVFDSEDENGKWLFKECIVSLDQTLPAGVYANPDELSDLRRIRKLNAVPKNRVNVELPAEQSDSSSVYIISKLKHGKAYLWLPVHARYHKAVAGGGTARNDIEAPKLYLRCPDQRLDLCNKMTSAASFLCNGSSKEKCSWKLIPYTMMTDMLVWRVPVGNMDHYYLVAIGTGTVIVLGSLYLLKSIHEYKVSVGKKNS